jgi:hypothetical protein
MSDQVAVYIDFDNVVISRYDNVHGDGAWRRDQARDHRRSLGSSDPIDVRLAEGEIDLGAIIDYAASFGTVALTRAYADWSAPANAAYKAPLVSWSIDLVQLFTTSGLKNGADIRLAVDAVEDLVQHSDISHVVFVAGDSDYVPLAQRCKRLGRYVVGIGVAGSTSRALVSACNEFIDYADLPGVAPPPAPRGPAQATAPTAEAAVAKEAVTKKATAKKATKKAAKTATKQAAAPAESAAEAEATSLLVRAVRVGLQKSDDDWIYAGGVKSQMQRMNPAFKEKTLGFSSFRAFVESRARAVESKADNKGQLMVRLP